CAHNATDQVFGLFESLEPHYSTVPDRLILQEQQRRNHGCFWGSGCDSPVARKNTSSRLASPVWLAYWRALSSMVPKLTFCPFLRIRMCEQISCTSGSKCELMIMAAPSRARLRIESFILRMPIGSSPVNGSSK